LGWFIFSRVPLFYKLFNEKNIEKYLKFDLLSDFIDDDSIFSINLGSKGPERKISIIGQSLRTNENFFIKFGNSDISRNLINNEIKILSQKSNFDFIPSIIKYNKSKTHCILKTKFLEGRKRSNNFIDDKILSLLLNISKTEGLKKNQEGLYTVFSHGDFCPWNIMDYNGTIQVFDWEMAGNYSLGYDLFSYIFQTSFLISNKSAKDIYEEYIYFIEDYFKEFEVNVWKGYLKSFSSQKLQKEMNNNNIKLINSYKKLKEFCEKI